MEGGIWGLCLGLGCPVPRWLQLLECRSLPSRLPPLPSPEKAAASSFCLSRVCQCLLWGAGSMTAPESCVEQRGQNSNSCKEGPPQTPNFQRHTDQKAENTASVLLQT